METVLITGCSSGIGDATARAFAEEGWTVYATARDPDDLQELAEIGCETAQLDVTDPDQIETAVDRLVDEQGRIDVLVNNAGYAKYAPLEDVPTADLQKVFDVNVYGPQRLMRAVLPHMREHGDGTIINVSSVAGRVAHPIGSAYCGSKFALEGMSDALRAEVGSFGVDVVLVEPGPVDTGFTDRAAEEDVPEESRTAAYDRLYNAYQDAALVGGGGPLASEPAEVATVILNAASCTDPAARYTVGTFARLAVLARFLPARLQDASYRLIAKVAG